MNGRRLFVMKFCLKPYDKKSAVWILTAVLLAACLLAGCVASKGYAFQVSDGYDFASDDPVVYDINRLGFDVLRLVSQDDGEGRNLILSPLSLATALSVVGNGAAGTTQEQIHGLINSRGLPQDEHIKRYNGLISSFCNRENVQILLANSLWVNKEYPVRESFVKLAKTWYDADVFSLKANSPSSVKEINRWVSDKTRGLITDPISDIDPLTVVLLVNTLYFKGASVNEFSERLTQKEAFTLSSGETVMVDMMNDQFRVPYYDAGDFKAVKLYYKGGASMLFLRPEGNVDELVEALTADKLLEISSKLSACRTNLKIPRLDFSYKDEMSRYLKALGMVEAFTEEADFRQIVDLEQVHVDSVLHECRIKLDEEGTEAAAVTAIAVTATSAMPEPEQIVDLYLDKPFVFAIVDERTGAVLFLGKVENPLG